MTKEDRIRAEIIEAAQRMFQRYGYRKTTIEEMAAEAGKGKSTLYYYFRNKEEIFLAVIWDEWDTIISQANEALKDKHTVEERLKTYILVKIKGIANFANVYRSLRSELLEKYPFIPKFREEAKARETQLILDLIRSSSDRNRLRYQGDEELELIAFSLVNILLGIQQTILQGSGQGKYEQPRLLNTIAAMLLNGILST